MRKGSGSAYDKWNISVVICDTYIANVFDEIFSEKREQYLLFLFKGK